MSNIFTKIAILFLLTSFFGLFYNTNDTYVIDAVQLKQNISNLMPFRGEKTGIVFIIDYPNISLDNNGVFINALLTTNLDKIQGFYQIQGYGKLFYKNKNLYITDFNIINITSLNTNISVDKSIKLFLDTNDPNMINKTKENATNIMNVEFTKPIYTFDIDNNLYFVSFKFNNDLSIVLTEIPPYINSLVFMINYFIIIYFIFMYKKD